MKKLFFAIGILLSTFSFSQEEISIIKLTFESYYGFTAGSKADVHSGFNIQNDSTYKVDRVGHGYNNITIDLKNKTFENNAVVDQKIYKSIDKLENVQIKNDTLSFYMNTRSRFTGVPYTEYFVIVLTPKENSREVFAVNMWINPKYGNVVGTYLDTSFARMTIE